MSAKKRAVPLAEDGADNGTRDTRRRKHNFFARARQASRKSRKPSLCWRFGCWLRAAAERLRVRAKQQLPTIARVFGERLARWVCRLLRLERL